MRVLAARWGWKAGTGLLGGGHPVVTLPKQLGNSVQPPEKVGKDAHLVFLKDANSPHCQQTTFPR